MEELIKIEVENDQQLVSARDLHKALELKRHFGDWVKQNFKDFEEGADFMGAPQSAPITNGNGRVQYLDDYAVTIDMAKELCMMSKTPKGKEVRQYFIKVEKDWNNQQAIVERAYNILHSENLQLKLIVKEQAPKVTYYDQVIDKNGLTNFRDTAKMLGWKPKAFNQLLEDHGYIYRTGSKKTIKPYAEYVAKGYFEIKDTSSGFTQTLITPKGRAFFNEKWGKNNE
jgi:anti-repressor protein